MKAKIIRGSGFRGALDYALDKNKNIEIVGGNMSSTNARALSSEFKISRQLRPEITRPVWHCSLSCPIGEKLSSEKWQKITDNFMEKMQFSENNQYIVVRHNDTDYDHVHIIASRISLAGEVWAGRWEAKKAINITQEIEQKYNLVQTKGFEKKADIKNLSSNEIQMSVRMKKAAPRAVLQQIIQDVLKDKPDVSVFLERLNAANIAVRPNIAKTGRMSGFAFEYNNIMFKGSQLGKLYTWKGLQKQGLQYEQDRDSAALSAARERFDTRADKGIKELTKGQRAEHRAISSSDRAVSTGHGSIDRRDSGLIGKTAETAKKINVSEQSNYKNNSGFTKNKQNNTMANGNNINADKRFDSDNSINRVVSVSMIAKTKDKENDKKDKKKEKKKRKKVYKKYKKTLEIAFVEDEKGQYVWNQYNHVAFVDNGNQILLKSKSQTAIKAIIQLAQSKGWNNIMLDVKDVKTAQVMYAEARKAGYKAENIKFKNAMVAEAMKSFFENFEQNFQEKPKFKKSLPLYIQTKIKIFERQHAALDASAYRITVVDALGKKKPWNLGKKNNTEKYFSAAEVKEKIPQLSAKNAQGFNVYITPIDDQYHYIVLDDTDKNKITELKKAGFKPCFIQESSPNNRQAIFKIKKIASDMEQKAANAVVRRLNKKYGDPNFSGVIHPFRLSGFTNRKLKYKDKKGNYPFVKIIETNHGKICKKMQVALEQERNNQAQAQAQVRKQRIKKIGKNTISTKFQNAVNKVGKINIMYARERLKLEKLIQEKNWNRDESQIDFKVAKILVEQGFKKIDIINAIAEESPAVSERHSDIMGYAAKTVDAAEIAVTMAEDKTDKTDNKDDENEEIEYGIKM